MIFIWFDPRFYWVMGFAMMGIYPARRQETPD